MNIEQPPRSPFELTLIGMTWIAVAVVILAIGLFLTDVGVVNW